MGYSALSILNATPTSHITVGLYTIIRHSIANLQYKPMRKFGNTTNLDGLRGWGVGSSSGFESRCAQENFLN